MKKILISLYFLTVTAGFAASAQNIQAAIEAISADPVFSQAIVGICARTEDGQVIAEVNPGKMMVPASNMKLISTDESIRRILTEEVGNLIEAAKKVAALPEETEETIS